MSHTMRRRSTCTLACGLRKAAVHWYSRVCCPIRWTLCSLVCVAMQVSKHDLKKRPYLGPTSLVPDLSLLMANAARVQPHQLVLEPFVGTGSLAIAAAELGAVVLGTDIDIRVLRGKQGRNLSSCFAHYGLGKPELLRADNSLRYAVCYGVSYVLLFCGASSHFYVLDCIASENDHLVTWRSAAWLVAGVTVSSRCFTRSFAIHPMACGLVQGNQVLVTVGNRWQFPLSAVPRQSRRHLFTKPLMQVECLGSLPNFHGVVSYILLLLLL